MRGPAACRSLAVLCALCAAAPADDPAGRQKNRRVEVVLDLCAKGKA